MVNLPRLLWATLILSGLNLFSIKTIAIAQTDGPVSDIFATALGEIKGELLPNLVLRLPQQILGKGESYSNNPNLTVRVFSSPNQQRSTVAIYRCEVGAYSCLVGTFSVTGLDSSHGKYLWQQHQQQGSPLTIAPGLRAYVLEEQNLNVTSGFASVMWPQDGGFYTITFPKEERQNLLYMAVDMAAAAPIYSDRN